jgi:hypothetical protein
MYMYIFFQRNIMWRQNTFLIGLITHKILAQTFIPPVSAVIDCTSSLRVHMSCYRIFLHEQFQKHIIGIPGLNQSFDTNVYVLYIFWLHLCMRNNVCAKILCVICRILYIDKYTHFDIQCVQPNVFMDGFVNVIHFS